MPCCQGQDYDQAFDAKGARKELRGYEKRGARGETRRLLEAVRDVLRARGDAEFTHLDIGGGVGVLQHELVADGATRTTAVDASRPYLEVARSAAAERGYADRHMTLEGDFTELADEVEASDVVTLDKVICCYPDMPSLVRASAAKAKWIYAIVIPRDAPWMKLFARVANWFMRTVLRWQFQGYVYAHAAIDTVCREQGLTLVRDQPGMIMCVRVYERGSAT